jgi:hypothetical protein
MKTWRDYRQQAGAVNTNRFRNLQPVKVSDATAAIVAAGEAGDMPALRRAVAVHTVSVKFAETVIAERQRSTWRDDTAPAPGYFPREVKRGHVDPTQTIGINPRSAVSILQSRRDSELNTSIKRRHEELQRARKTLRLAERHARNEAALILARRAFARIKDRIDAEHSQRVAAIHREYREFRFA